MNAIVRITEAEVLLMGLKTIGYDLLRQQKTQYSKNLQRFRAAFGTLPITASQAFSEIQDQSLGEARIKKPNADYLLMALMWLNLYSTESQLAGQFKLDEKTVRKWIWSYLLAIHALKEKVVRKIKLYFLFRKNCLISFILFDKDCLEVG